MNTTRATLLSLILVLLALPAVDAHAVLERAQPAPGSRLLAGPTEVWIAFNERVEPGSIRLAVYQGGNRTDLSLPSSLETSQTGARVRLPTNVSKGSYVAEWEALSQVDGHTSSGAWAFGVGEEAVVVTPDVPTTPIHWWSAAGKALIFLGFAFVGGFLAFQLWIWRVGPAYLPPWMSKIALTGAVFVVLGLLTLLFSESATNGQDPLNFGLETAFGRGLLWRILLAVSMIAAIMLDRKTANRLSVTAVLFLASIVIAAYFSHAAALSPIRWLGTAVDTFHLVAATAWAGGLVYLFGSIRRASSSTPDPTVLQASLRFSTLAQGAIVVLTVSGLVMLLFVLGPIDAQLWEKVRTRYGMILAYKVALAVLMMGLGAVNHFFFVRKMSRPGALLPADLFHANVRREAVNGVLVLLVAALLTTLAPGA